MMGFDFVVGSVRKATSVPVCRCAGKTRIDKRTFCVRRSRIRRLCGYSMQRSLRKNRPLWWYKSLEVGATFPDLVRQAKVSGMVILGTLIRAEWKDGEPEQCLELEVVGA